MPVAAIFDLDGVVVDTAVHHFAAWRELAQRFGFDLTPEDDERLKGVGRMDALRIVLGIGGVDVPDAEATALADEKNARYVQQVARLTPADILPGARELLETLRAHGVPVALASASSNARAILERLEIGRLFDVVVDGTVVREAKPDPRVFLVAAERLGVAPDRCVVLEDAVAGVRAATAAGMVVLGVGDPAVLTEADHVVQDLRHVDLRLFGIDADVSPPAPGRP